MEQSTPFVVDSVLRTGLIRNFGPGAVRLEESELVWESYLPLLLRKLAYNAPRRIRLVLRDIERANAIKDGSRTWLYLQSEEKPYYLRLGRGKWILRDEPELVFRLLEAIEAARAA
jgi:hypothetical protein